MNNKNLKILLGLNGTISMRCMILGFALMVATGDYLCSQTKHPWHVVDNGGGRSVGGSMTLSTSVGQPAAQSMSGPAYNLESGYLPGIRLLSGTISALQVSVDASWNMVSVPLVESDYHRNTLFPGASSSAFAYENGYRIADSLANGVGYWLKFPSASSLAMTGTSLALDTIGVVGRWNMVGGISYPVPVSNVAPVLPVSITSFFFGYESGSGYFRADTLKPGKGYWVRASGNGKLVVNSGSFEQSRTSSLVAAKRSSASSGMGILSGQEPMSSLTVRDAKGRERTVYFMRSPPREGLDDYELPPMPPIGILDVRYESGRSLEVADEVNSKDVTLSISSASYPVTLRWDNTEHLPASLIVDGTLISMTGSGTTHVAAPSQVHVKLEPASHPAPDEFTLDQNYPNPFNPTTVIGYQLPVKSYVKLIVYNMLGQEVTTLVDGWQAAGYMSVQWNVSQRGIASGMYFYRLEATHVTTPGKTFSQVRTMVLLK